MRKNTRALLAAAALLTTLSVGLTGCAAIEQAVTGEKSTTYDDAAAFRADSGADAPWMPADATAIAMTQSTRAADAALTLASSTPLDESLCAEVERQSAPLFTVTEAVDVYKTTTAFACGDWTVVQTPGGWLGWTPGHPDEKEQSPS